VLAAANNALDVVPAALVIARRSPSRASGLSRRFTRIAICDDAIVAEPAVDFEGAADMADQLAVHVMFQLSVADYRSAVIEVTKQSVPSVAFGTFTVGMSVIPILGGDLASVVALLFGLSLLTGLYCLPFIWWAIRKRSDLLLSRQELTADARGIRIATPTTTSEQTWPTFSRVRELTNVFLLDYGTGANAMVPRRALDASTAEQFRRLVSSVGILEQPSRWTNFVRGIGLGTLLAVVFVAVISILASSQR
jgi:hypothetical protein